MYIYVYIYIYIHLYLTFSTDSTQYTYRTVSGACARALFSLLSLFLPRSFSLSVSHTRTHTHSLTPIHPLSLVPLPLFSHAAPRQLHPHPAFTPKCTRSDAQILKNSDCY